MPQVKTLYFLNNSSGQRQKNAALAAHLAIGWTVVFETITPGKFRGCTACCNFLICAPLAFLAGSTDGTINLTLQYNGSPEQLATTPTKWNGNPSESGAIGKLIVGLIVLLFFVGLCSRNDKTDSKR